ARPPRSAGRPAHDHDGGRAPSARVRARAAWMSHQDAAKVMTERAGLEPRVGIVLGSGLGAVADAVTDAAVVDYADLPGFPRPTVEGHGGRAVLGRIGDVPVAVLQGRAHVYEGGDLDAIRTPVRALHAAGAEILVLTNAAGSVRPAGWAPTWPRACTSPCRGPPSRRPRRSARSCSSGRTRSECPRCTRRPWR